MSVKVRVAEAKLSAAVKYVMLHKKQLSAAVAFGAAVLEAAQKAH